MEMVEEEKASAPWLVVGQESFGSAVDTLIIASEFQLSPIQLLPTLRSYDYPTFVATADAEHRANDPQLPHLSACSNTRDLDANFSTSQ